MASHHAPGPPPPSCAKNRRHCSARRRTGLVDADGHDGHHEQRFAVTDAVVQVVERRLPAHLPQHQQEQRDDPDAEDHLHLAKKVQHAGQDQAGRRAGMGGVGLPALFLPFFQPVRQLDEFVRQKGMHHRGQKNQRGPQVERFLLRAVRQHVPHAGQVRVMVTFQRRRELDDVAGRSLMRCRRPGRAGPSAAGTTCRRRRERFWNIGSWPWQLKTCRPPASSQAHFTAFSTEGNEGNKDREQPLLLRSLCLLLLVAQHYCGGNSFLAACALSATLANPPK